MTEKILAKHSNNTSVAPGQNIWTEVDKLLTHDVCGPGTFGIFQKEFGENADVWDNEKVVIIPDHYIFTADPRANRNVDILRDISKQYNIKCVIIALFCFSLCFVSDVECFCSGISMTSPTEVTSRPTPTTKEFATLPWLRRVIANQAKFFLGLIPILAMLARLGSLPLELETQMQDSFWVQENCWSRCHQRCDSA